MREHIIRVTCRLCDADLIQWDVDLSREAMLLVEYTEPVTDDNKLDHAEKTPFRIDYSIPHQVLFGKKKRLFFIPEEIKERFALKNR